MLALLDPVQGLCREPVRKKVEDTGSHDQIQISRRFRGDRRVPARLRSMESDHTSSMGCSQVTSVPDGIDGHGSSINDGLHRFDLLRCASQCSRNVED